MRRGFTLIELLLVIGIISTLASVVIIAVNPQKQLCSATDAKRKSAARELKNALYQYLIDFGRLPATFPSGVENADPVCAAGVTDPSCLNFDALVPTYMVSLPVDMSETNTNYAGYTVYQDPDGFPLVAIPYLGQCGGGREEEAGSSASDASSAESSASVASSAAPQSSAASSSAHSSAAPSCGNSIVEGGEECDAGGVDAAMCDSDCTAPSCGDGHINEVAISPEECDDTTPMGSDGCTGCEVETGWECAGEPSVCHTVCGDLNCLTMFGENACNCPGDCFSAAVCGDGCCTDPSENCYGCPNDCGCSFPLTCQSTGGSDWDCLSPASSSSPPGSSAASSSQAASSSSP